MAERFELPTELDIYGANDLRDALLAWVGAQQAQGSAVLEVSARAVREVDGAGLQLLASLGNGDLPWRLLEPSQEFSEACRVMGLAHWLDGQPLQGAGP